MPIYYYRVIQTSRRGTTGVVAYHGTRDQADQHVERLQADPALDKWDYHVSDQRVEIREN